MRTLPALLSASALLAACGETALPPFDYAPADGGSADAAAQPEDAGGSGDAGAAEPDAGGADAGQRCTAIVPATQPLDWKQCYSEEWPVYTGGMQHVLATWFTGLAAGAAEWTDADDRGFYLALPMSWVFKGRGQADYNQGTYSLVDGPGCATHNFCDPPRTNIPPRQWGMQFCVRSLTTGRQLVAQLVDAGPADRLRTALSGAYDGAQTWLDLSPGAAAFLATGDAQGTPDNQIVTFWEGACE